MTHTENSILKGLQSGYVHIPKSPERALKSRVYNSGQYLLTQRHIELNSVRTGMEEYTRAYYWTTYATNANATN